MLIISTIWSQFRHSERVQTHRMKHFLRILVLGMGLAAPLGALAAPPPPAAIPVQALDNALAATMKAASAGQSFNARAAALAPVIARTYDLPEVAKNSVGFLWGTLPAAQQKELTSLFAQFTVASYVSQFNADNGLKFELLPTEKDLGAKRIVQTRLVPADGGGATELDYVVAHDANGWRITDVLLDGTISQVAVHASDFASLVKAGDATPLIAALKRKITALSGTPS